jgi:hypothetical protein
MVARYPASFHMRFDFHIGHFSPVFHIPLAYREDSVYPHLGNRWRLHEQTDRLGPMRLGPSYSEDPGVGAVPWPGDRPAPQASFRRRPAGQRWITLPGLAQAGTGGLDHRRVEAERE